MLNKFIIRNFIYKLIMAFKIKQKINKLNINFIKKLKFMDEYIYAVNFRRNSTMQSEKLFIY